MYDTTLSFVQIATNILRSKLEQQMADIIRKSKLVRFGYSWRFRGPQLQAEKHLLQNKRT